MRQALDVTHVPYPNCFRCPFNLGKCDDGSCCLGTVDWIEKTLFNTTTPPEEVAGIVLEVVQGEGGYIPAPTEFVRALRRICDEHGIMLIIDEVQSGMGRTGKMFALDHHPGVKADIMCLAKGLGSGMPIGACIARADIMDWHKGAHASTFGGNPVALTAALKTIELAKPQTYHRGEGDTWHEFEVTLLEATDEYIHVRTSVNDGSLVWALKPMTSSFLIYRDGRIEF